MVTAGLRIESCAVQLMCQTARDLWRAMRPFNAGKVKEKILISDELFDGGGIPHVLNDHFHLILVGVDVFKISSVLRFQRVNQCDCRLKVEKLDGKRRTNKTKSTRDEELYQKKVIVLAFTLASSTERGQWKS